MREVKLNQMNAVLSTIEYPATQESLVEECSDVSLLLADGRENLGGIIAQSNDETFDSMDDLANEVMNLLPRHAVGEPYQSEGEG